MKKCKCGQDIKQRQDIDFNNLDLTEHIGDLSESAAMAIKMHLQFKGIKSEINKDFQDTDEGEICKDDHYFIVVLG
jgi:hypothetical protein